MPDHPDLTTSDAHVRAIFAQYQPRLLIIGAAGQIGVELATVFSSLLPPKNITLADIGPGLARLQKIPALAALQKVPCDVTNLPQLTTLLNDLHPDITIDLAAMLSNQMKDQPVLGFDINFGGPYNLLKALHTTKLPTQQPILFVPSSIAATGVVGLPPPRPDQAAGIADQNTTYTHNTGNRYGQTKAALEGIMGAMAPALHIKAVAPRWPIIASPTKNVGIGATDYVVQITRSALRNEPYACPLAPDKHLPILAGEDMVRTVTYPLAKALTTPLDQMRTTMPHAYHYNIPSLSLSPRDLAEGLRAALPPSLHSRIQTTFDPDNPINAILNVYFERTEGTAILHDCNYHLQHNTLQKFTTYLLRAYTQNPTLLFNESDSQAKQQEIRQCCTEIATGGTG